MVNYRILGLAVIVVMAADGGFFGVGAIRIGKPGGGPGIRIPVVKRPAVGPPIIGRRIFGGGPGGPKGGAPNPKFWEIGGRGSGGLNTIGGAIFSGNIVLALPLAPGIALPGPGSGILSVGALPICCKDVEGGGGREVCEIVAFSVTAIGASDVGFDFVSILKESSSDGTPVFANSRCLSLCGVSILNCSTSE